MTLMHEGEPSPTDIILEHAHRRTGTGADLTGVTVLGSARLLSPTCGDAISVSLIALDTEGVAVRWDGRGCALSQASASVLTESAEGLRGVEVDELIETFLHAMGTRSEDSSGIVGLGDAMLLLPVAGNAVRASCVTLAWRAVREARGSSR